MIIHITNRCQMNCPHCADECIEEGIDISETTASQFVRFADLNKNPMNPVIIVSGGEPTMHPNFAECMYHIIMMSHPSMIVLATNGYFLYDEKLKKDMMDLAHAKVFAIQLSAINGLYKNTDKTKHLFKDFMATRTLATGDIIEKITVIDYLGRAKQKPKEYWKKYTDYQRKAPNCFNMISCIQSSRTNSFSDVLTVIHGHNSCKPLVRPNGDIHLSESKHCHKIGTVWDDDQTLYENALKLEPCGKCGVPYEEHMNKLKQMYNL